MPDLALRPPYRHELFINREAEVSQVIDRARAVAAGTTRDRVVNYNAPRGAGKSWLLQEVDWQLRDDPVLRPCYINLSDYTSETTEQVEKVVRTVLAVIHQKIGDVSLADVVSALIEKLKSSKQVYVLLFDHIGDSSDSLLEALDDAYLSAVVNLPNVMIVLAGRGRQYTWKAPQLRVPPLALEAFDTARTREQLASQVPLAASQADQVQKLSNGYPLANYLYGLRLASPSASSLDVVNTLLGEWVNCRDEFEALCVLQAFDESRIPVMFAEYSDDPACLDWDYARCSQIRGDLIATTLAQWDGSKRGYVIDEAIRPILENDIFVRDKTLWCRLHSAAYKLYSNWAKRHELSRADWEAEVQYHANKLEEAGLRPGYCLNVSVQIKDHPT